MAFRVTSSVQAPPNNPDGVPSAFTAGQWSVADAGTGGDATITITAIPDLNGAAWLDVHQYDLDAAGNWQPIPGTNAASPTGTFTLAGVFTDGVATNVQIRAVNSDGPSLASDTKSVTTSAGAPDITAPVLSALTASESGATSWTGSVTTDEGNGTLYYLISTNATETDAAVKGGLTVSVSATGVIPLSGGGLAASTLYYLHVLHRDAAGNDSAQPTPVSFTTDAAGVATGSLTASLAKATNPAVAPHLVHFDLSVSGASLTESAANAWDPTHQGIVYVHDFGNPGAVSDKVVNVPTQWNDLNIGYGKHPAHVYPSGSYTATFRAYEHDGTLVGEDTVEVMVNDPGTIFTGTRTILVDPDGVGDNATYPGSNVVTTWAAAFNALAALNQTGRILLKRGTVTQITSQQVIGSAFDNFYVGAWGTGAKPVIQLPNSNSITAGGNSSAPGRLFFIVDSANYSIVFTGIKFQGPWNSVDETGGQYYCIQTTMVGDSKRILIDDCEFDGWARAYFSASNGTAAMAHGMNNSSVTNWGDYCIYQSSNRNDHFSLIGCSFAQSEQALQGGDGFGTANGAKKWVSAQHGPLRCAMRYRTYFDVLDLFNRNGWFINSNEPTTQPCIRAHFSTDVSPSVYPHSTISRTAMEGGGQAIFQLKDQNDDDDTNPGGALNLLMDKILIVATADTWTPFNVAWTGWTLRNCIMVAPNFETRNNSWRGFFDSQDLNVTTRVENPVEIYNSTFINFKDATALNGATARFDEDIDGTTLTDDYTEDNNALYQVSGTTEAIDLDLATAMPTVGGTWTSRYLGTRWSDVGAPAVTAQLTLNTALASPAGLVTTLIPNASSPLVDDATSGLTAYDDFYGTVRTGTRDRGAIER